MFTKKLSRSFLAHAMISMTDLSPVKFESPQITGIQDGFSAVSLMIRYSKSWLLCWETFFWISSTICRRICRFSDNAHLYVSELFNPILLQSMFILDVFKSTFLALWFVQLWIKYWLEICNSLHFLIYWHCKQNPKFWGQYLTIWSALKRLLWFGTI